MIEVRNISKQFDGYTAVSHMDLEIADGSIFGLIGSNGAGKSTFLRMASGILRPDEGQILIDGGNVLENPEAKQRLFFISDDAFFFANATPGNMAAFYKKYYPAFDDKAFYEMLEAFGLDPGRKLRGFSKGMKKQFFAAAGLAAGTKYLFCDETFDGLDPVMRQAVKRLFAAALADRGLTVVLASHNLRELEDICDHVGLMHRGGVLLSKDLEDMKESLCKVQVVLRKDGAAADAGSTSGTSPGIPPAFPEGLVLVRREQRGSLATLILRGDAAEADSYFTSLDPVFYERIPLSLEEIFITETEAAGYDVKNLLA